MHVFYSCLYLHLYLYLLNKHKRELPLRVWNYVGLSEGGKSEVDGGVQIARANTQSDEAFKMRK